MLFYGAFCVTLECFVEFMDSRYIRDSRQKHDVEWGSSSFILLQRVIALVSWSLLRYLSRGDLPCSVFIYYTLMSTSDHPIPKDVTDHFVFSVTVYLFGYFAPIWYSLLVL